MATALGWTIERDGEEMPSYKSRGPTLGWIDTRKDEMLIDISSGFNVIKKAAGADLSLTKQTLIKRLKDGGKLTRSDETRQRNTVRVTAEGHLRHVIALELSAVLEKGDAADE